MSSPPEPWWQNSPILIGGGVALAAIGLVLVGVRTSAPETDAEYVEHPAPSGAWNTVPRPTTGPPVELQSAPVDLCNAHDQWFGRTPHGGVLGAAQGSFVAHFRKAGAPCRRKAIEGECGTRCNEVLSDMLIEAAADESERRALRQYRYDHNAPALRAGQEMLAKTKTIVAYAKSIRTSPRQSAYRSPNASGDEIVEALVTSPCLARMKLDFARIDALRKAVDENATKMPIALNLQLGPALLAAKSCVDCSDNRIMCDEMDPDMENAAETMAEHTKLLAEDKAALGRGR